MWVLGYGIGKLVWVTAHVSKLKRTLISSNAMHGDTVVLRCTGREQYQSTSFGKYILMDAYYNMDI